MEKRPKVFPNFMWYDQLLEILAYLLVISLIIIPVYFYPDLPDEIPRHFNASGEPDTYGSKSFIWFLPGIGIALFIGLTLINRIPHHFNYTVNVTEENAKELYTISTRMIRILKVMIMVIFNYLNIHTILIALNKSAGLGGYFFPVMIVLIVGLVLIMILKMNKVRR